jgi:bacterioferritin (cytochrome b1)
MGFDLDRSEMRHEPAADEPLFLGASPGAAEQLGFSRALSRNMLAERFAIEAYRKIAEHGENYDRATLRLVKVALAVEEEHAEILSAIMENLRNLNGAVAG